MSKRKHSITDHYFATKKPTVVQQSDRYCMVGGRSFYRLSFGYPEPRLPIPSWDLANRINSFFLPNAIYFLDTNFLSRPIPKLICEALLSRRIAIAPLIAKEIEPWLKHPFNNPLLHNIVLKASERRNGQWLRQLVEFDPNSKPIDRIIFPQLDRHYLDFAYRHYHSLLAIRRLIGFEIGDELFKTSGLRRNKDAIRTEIMRRYGDRGFLVASDVLKRGVRPNFLADEQMILMAAITAICTGHETIILTWDTAIEDQFFKLWHLISTDYLAHWAGEWAAQESNYSKFATVEIADEKRTWLGEEVKTFSALHEDLERAVLPQKFVPVFSSCLVIGGETNKLIVSPQAFCAERQIVNFLKIKELTGGKNTSQFGSADICVAGSPNENGKEDALSVFILKPRIINCCGRSMSWISRHAALKTDEKYRRVGRRLICQKMALG